MNRTKLFTDKEHAMKMVALKRKEGKAWEMKEEVWVRGETRRIKYRVNYEA